MIFDNNFNCYCLVNVRSASAIVVASLTAHVGLHVTEAHVGFTSILIFVGSRINRRIVADILP